MERKEGARGRWQGGGGEGLERAGDWAGVMEAGRVDRKERAGRSNDKGEMGAGGEGEGENGKEKGKMSGGFYRWI